MAAVSAKDSSAKPHQISKFEMKVEDFECPICIDLVYKPVVNSCGHIFCFWCVHRSMNPCLESHCPLCRKVFAHFPRICEMLHDFLKQAFPKEYAFRALEVKEAELSSQVFSPNLGESLEISEARTAEFASVNSVKSTSEGDKNGLDERNARTPSPSESQRPPKDSKPSLPISPEIFFCTACNQLLHLPMVLNCGHAICFECIYGESRVPSNSISFRCPKCKSQEPSGRLEVCLKLHEITETLFPEMAAKRREQRREASGKGAAGNGGHSTNQSGLERVIENGAENNSCLNEERIRVSCLDGTQSHPVQSEASGSGISGDLGGREGEEIMEEGGEMGGKKNETSKKKVWAELGLEISHAQRALANILAVQQRLERSGSEEERKELEKLLAETRRQNAIHIGVGCDGCGAFPIMGPRFRCCDCPEAVGFDLCQECHELGVELGRFDQRHKSSHAMVEEHMVPGYFDIPPELLAFLNVADFLEA